MEDSLKQLAKYRMERAYEMLEASTINLLSGQYRTSLNRSYYAILHAIRAVNILDGFDSSKHSGCIAHFNQCFVKTNIIEKRVSSIIRDSSLMREKSDYDDFFIVSEKDAKEQLANAKEFVEIIQAYLKETGNHNS